MESKMNTNPNLSNEVEDMKRLKCLQSLGFDGMAFVPSVGRSGGLVAVWRSDQVHVVVVELDRQFIHLECSFEGGPPFLFTSIYSIPDQRHKQILWDAMEGYASVNLNPWVVMGDFNDIALNGEKSGGSGGNEMRMRRFTERLRRCRLSDLGACGPRYTWKGRFLWVVVGYLSGWIVLLVMLLFYPLSIIAF
ncbi:hypothetical protein K1719_022524 [Acacia pycnantha]|nr:hypothetical protein K1719_022524 [Acacia pycnantha]